MTREQMIGVMTRLMVAKNAHDIDTLLSLGPACCGDSATPGASNEFLSLAENLDRPFVRFFHIHASMRVSPSPTRTRVP